MMMWRWLSGTGRHSLWDVPTGSVGIEEEGWPFGAGTGPRFRSSTFAGSSGGGAAHRATMAATLAGEPGEAVSGEAGLRDLGRRTAHGAVISTLAQGVAFVLRMGSMVVLARLLAPIDFGLVGMVTAFTGFLGFFRDAGLSMATVQRATVSHDQTSALFWINMAVGGALASLCCVGLGPLLAWFYGEPRVFWVSVVIGASFTLSRGGGPAPGQVAACDAL